MPLPTTPDALKPFFDGAEISGWQDVKVFEVMSDVKGFGDMLTEAVKHNISPDTMDALNYLAARIKDFDEEDHDAFFAAAEAGKHCDSLAEIINLTDNLSRFAIQPAYDAEQYGEFLIEVDKDATSAVFNKLVHSEYSDERGLSQYIQRLEESVNVEAYGRAAAEQEEGVFTEYGYLTEAKNEFKTVYHGPEDIPAEYRVFSQLLPELDERPVMVYNTDLAALLLEMHAVGGEYMRDAKHNLKTLATGGEDYLLMVNAGMIIVTPADLAFRRDTNEHDFWMLAGNSPDIHTYVMSVTDRSHGQISGNLFEVELSALHDYIRENSFYFTHLDAEMKDGSSRRFTLSEWDSMEPYDRDQLKSWVKHYDPADEARLATYLGVLRWAVEENRQAVSTGEFLSGMNRPFMAQASNPRSGMLRLSQETAKQMLAQNENAVYRLLPGGPQQLAPVEAVKTGLWYSSDREFAINIKDTYLLHKWAERTSTDMLRKTERGEHKNSRDNEH